MTKYPDVSNRENRKHRLSALNGQAFAHRGLHDNVACPENSLNSINWTVNEGFGLEIDVRLSKDGQPVLFHDANLADKTGFSGSVESLEWKELQTIPLLGSKEMIPNLGAALDLIDGRVPVLFDLKVSDNSISIAQTVCRALDPYPGDFAILSQCPKVLSWIHANQPRFTIARGIDVSAEPHFGNWRLAQEIWATKRKLGVDFLCLPIESLTTLSAAVANTYLPVVVWGVSSPGQWNWARRWVKNFIFDLSPVLPLSVAKKHRSAHLHAQKADAALDPVAG